jgi:hypothetical protein
LQVLKLYAWEMTFKEKLIDKRNLELRKLLNLEVIKHIVETSFHITPCLVCKFISYIMKTMWEVFSDAKYM